MKKISSLKIFVYIIGFICLSGIFSCSSIKNVRYLTDVPDSNVMVEKTTAKYIEPTIASDDIMSITIQTIDPTTSSSVNQATSMPTVGGGASVSSGGGQAVTGYLVDKNGEVEIPLIGKVKLAGLTTYEARDVIQKKASVVLKDPSVQVRFANFKVTVLGEVTRPSTYTLPNEKVSIFDAISLAGDLTVYGKRDNIMLIRDVDGKKDIVRLNLTSSAILSNPYYYLRQNDIIYVEPDKAKAATLNAETRSYVSQILSAISIIGLVIYRFK